ncbi:MAG: hypothetical protein KatS3mg102_1427 [Planctomycetota bacterium]|nr:MAG: hypothetical protein KatS3mg102_1427 [Planctomycetota bacterium]
MAAAPAQLWQLGAAAIARQVRAGELSALEVTEAFLARLEATEPHLRAWLHVDAEGARAAARALDARRARGEPLGPLAGVPVALKDNLCTRGMPTTAASRILEGYVPPYDATAVARLRAADAIVLGKTNLDEFAMGSSTENSAYGPTRNPWDLAGCRAAARAAVRRRWRRARRRSRSDRTPAVRSASRRRCAAWWVASRPTAR